jgi:hypothetical protein
MSDSVDCSMGGINNFAGGTQRHRTAPFAANAVREFLPQISPDQIEKIKSEMRGMIGQRIVLNNDQIVQVRRAVNIFLQDANQILTDAMSSARIVAILSGGTGCRCSFSTAPERRRRDSSGHEYTEDLSKCPGHVPSLGQQGGAQRSAQKPGIQTPADTDPGRGLSLV